MQECEGMISMARKVEHDISVELPPFANKANQRRKAPKRKLQSSRRGHQARLRAIELRNRLRRILDFRKGLDAERQSQLSMAARAAELLRKDPTKREPPTFDEITAFRHAYVSAAQAVEHSCERFDDQMVLRLGTRDILKRLGLLIADFEGLTDSDPPLIRKQQAISDAYDSLLPVSKALYRRRKAGEPWPDLEELLLLHEAEPTPAAFMKHVARLRVIVGNDDEHRLHVGYAATVMARALPVQTVAFWHKRLVDVLRKPAVADRFRKGKGGAKLATMHWIAFATNRQITWGTVRDYRKAVEERRKQVRRIAAQ
jgi:hypothetical protein